MRCRGSVACSYRSPFSTVHRYLVHVLTVGEGGATRDLSISMGRVTPTALSPRAALGLVAAGAKVFVNYHMQQIATSMCDIVCVYVSIMYKGVCQRGV